MWEPDYPNPILDKIEKDKIASRKKHLQTCMKNKSKRKRKK